MCLGLRGEETAMDSGSELRRCEHYARGCKIRAPCCGEVFCCRHCHNEAKNSLDVALQDRHDIPRHEIKKFDCGLTQSIPLYCISQVICSLCSKEQDVQQNCLNCGACMGKYFCEKCNFFDDDVSKNQYHCDGCGICRTGGVENFFHCDKCGCCYSNVLKDSHHCIEGAMHQNCPICYEYLFDTTKEISVLHCGHTIHMDCLNEMRRHYRYACPVCSKSTADMSEAWRRLDEEIAETPMPDNRMVWILCNDCGTTANVSFHVLAHKCPGCFSYNTRMIRGASRPDACSRV